ncbi:MAG: phosphoribosyltransferase family protein [Bacteroidota bacterium]|nr:phosphoribosyltransferase family protein [Bacteroidota bacterium]
MNNVFTNRVQAGLLLAEKLGQYKNSKAIVLAIPRGGIPVGFQIAQKLNLPLDVILTKKIGHPDNREFAIGSVSLDSFFAEKNFGVSQEYINNEVKRIRELLKQKYILFRGNRNPVSVIDKTVILVDDGIATGNTMRAAIKVLRKSKVAKIVVAVPIAPLQSDEIKFAADEYICLKSPANLLSIGNHYDDFSEVSDEEVLNLLNETTLKT